MKLTGILKQDAEQMYAATAALMKQVDDDAIDWKPESGRNWMTVGQLLEHCTSACGAAIKGFITGDWGIPQEQMEDMPPEEMLPPADKMPSAASMQDALAKRGADRKTALENIERAGEDDLRDKRFPPPWGGPERTLFQHLHEMIWHLGQHKGQLFYYLKLQGKDVDTMHLWGMASAESGA